MSQNGSNTWNVSFAQISWLERLIRSHGNFLNLSRHHDIVFELDRRQQQDHLSIICLNEYAMGLTAVHRVIHEFGKPSIIYIGGRWCGYTEQAKEFCLSERIGLYVTNEMSGALWASEYWGYHQRDQKGNPNYYFSREQA
ncbi:hypothetical protein [Alcaligenes sp. PF14]|uniref:hypothetical protein n=1 Tax=Alcaligenes sp. PF14 TaxID=3120297 RepID=UPI00301B3C0E